MTRHRRAEGVSRAVASAAMREPLHEVRAAIPVSGLGGFRLKLTALEIQSPPRRERELIVEWKAQRVRCVRLR